MACNQKSTNFFPYLFHISTCGEIVFLLPTIRHYLLVYQTLIFPKIIFIIKVLRNFFSRNFVGKENNFSIFCFCYFKKISKSLYFLERRDKSIVFNYKTSPSKSDHLVRINRFIQQGKNISDYDYISYVIRKSLSQKQKFDSSLHI